MGFAREKYTKAYFLRRDELGNPTNYGVIGIEEFEKGGIRPQDKALLEPINFKARTVLELGFGRGEAIKYALDHGATRVVGVDFSADAVAIARTFLEKHRLAAELVCTDALEFVRCEKHSGFEVVLLLDVIEHVPRSELRLLLGQMHRILRTRAVLVVNTPVFGADNDVLSEGLNQRARDESDDYPETAGMHCNRYTKASLKRFMRACGYDAIGGHFFVNQPIGLLPGLVPRLAWANAFRDDFPLSSGNKPSERFEMAYSTRQQERLRRLYSANRLVRRLGPRLWPLLWRMGF